MGASILLPSPAWIPRSVLLCASSLARAEVWTHCTHAAMLLVCWALGWGALLGSRKHPWHLTLNLKFTQTLFCLELWFLWSLLPPSWGYFQTVRLTLWLLVFRDSCLSGHGGLEDTHTCKVLPPRRCSLARVEETQLVQHMNASPHRPLFSEPHCPPSSRGTPQVSQWQLPLQYFLYQNRVCSA